MQDTGDRLSSEGGLDFGGSHLGVGTSVVDDDVCHDFDVVVVEVADALPQLALVTVLGVEVIEVSGKVALIADGIAGRRKPDGSDARPSDLLRLVE